MCVCVSLCMYVSMRAEISLIPELVLLLLWETDRKNALYYPRVSLSSMLLLSELSSDIDGTPSRRAVLLPDQHRLLV